MKISFDFDGTLTEPAIRELVLALMVAKEEVYIVTTRMDEGMKDVYALAHTMGIKKENIFNTNFEDKADFFLKNNFEVDIHFDDDYFEIEKINKETKILGILVNIDLHPNQRST